MKSRGWIIAVASAAAVATNVGPALARPAGDDPLISRSVLFGNPDRGQGRLSPDGKQLAFLAPVNGVMNVWVGPAAHPDVAKPVTNDTSRGIRRYMWAYTNGHILFQQDKGGDENWRVYSVDIANGKTIDLTPMDGVAAQIDTVSDRFPDTILVGLNDRAPQWHDLYKINVKTGEKTLLQKNDGFRGFVTDDDYVVRFGMKPTKSGGMDVLKKNDKGEFEPFQTIPMEDANLTSPVGFDKAGKVLYMLDSRGRDTAALKSIDLATGKEAVMAEDPRADVSGAMVHPTTKVVQAVSVNYLRNEWKVLDPSIKADLEYLKGVTNGDFAVTSRSLDDALWTVSYDVDNGASRLYLYDRSAKKATFLFSNRKSLEGLHLSKMHPVVIPARDGLNLVSYLTLPFDSDSDGDAHPTKPLPMVLFVHGGPWARDDWGFDPNHQWLANRGYAVLSVNFRASTGFGKKFLNAGNGEWAGKMHDDLIDAVNWAVKEKIADPAKVAIMGGSYGGYATLVGLTFTPDVFACGVDIVGPSNLSTLLATIPPYWEAGIEQMARQIGDFRTEDGKKFLATRSPLTFVDRIKRPLLIAQGANDPRVKQAEADQIVSAMQAKKIPVTYVLYPDEGHGFARPQNRMSFYGVAEAFLSKHLGGRFEPIGEDLKGSSITVPTGSEAIPGLKETMK